MSFNDVRCHLLGVIIPKKVRTSLPRLLFPILLKVPPIVNVVVLLISFITLNSKVARLWLKFSGLMVLAECSLTILQPFFFLLGKFQFSVFKGSLVRSAARVSWCYNCLQAFREVVRLNVEF